MGPAALAQVLRPLTMQSHPDLLVGLQTSDDAAVFRLSDEMAIIQTVDFFTPIVDDPFTFGAISAANSMSDVYAMGGDVLFALNVAAFPDSLDPSILSAIFKGGLSKVTEAGAVIAGGHTVTDDEPKYGLSVTGRIHPSRIMTKAGAQPGDRLYLTKAIGTGVVTTALKNDAVSDSDLKAAVDGMLTLNRDASRIARSSPAGACTDVTGFGLLGHAYEIAEKSGVGLRIRASAVPLLPAAHDCATAGHQPGGLHRNREYFSQHPAGGVRIDPQVPEALVALLFGPETSGGLLISIAESAGDDLEARFDESHLPLWRIGDVLAGRGIDVAP
jgi:selenide,water dikinase